MVQLSERPAIERTGLLMVLSSPSGAGKTTLARRLIAGDRAGPGGGITMSVSVTTRKTRPGEVEGQDYIFVDEATFVGLREQGALLEWAKVFGNFYGTPREAVSDAVAKGRDVLFDIDWQGAQQIAEQMEDDLVRVFILPPSATALGERLRGRAQDPPEIVAKRMAEASSELSHWAEYDYVVVNSNIEESVAKLSAILAAERLKRRRLHGLAAFVRDLQAGL